LTVTFDQCNAFLLNKSIDFLKKNPDPSTFYKANMHKRAKI